MDCRTLRTATGTPWRPHHRQMAVVWIMLLASGMLSGCGKNGDHPAHAADAVGLDCSGAVTRSVGLELNDTAEDCSHVCRADSHCHAWSFNFHSRHCKLREFCDTFVFAESHVQAGWRPHAPEQLICPQPEHHLSCPGYDIAVISNKTFQGCCDACHGTLGCLVFTLQTNGSSIGNCHLKSRCPKKMQTKSSEYHTGWMQRPGNAVYVHDSPFYQVQRGWFNVTGYDCGDRYPATAIWYPIGAGPFGVVIMRPGMGGQLDKMDDWLMTIASLGMVVISPFTDRGTCGGLSWHDVLLILDIVVRDGLKCSGCDVPPPPLDLHSLAFMGHSMGAMAATQASYMVRNASVFPYAANVTVRAVVASHDAYGVENMPPDVAFLVTGGDADGRMPAQKVSETFALSPARRKLGACMHHAFHMEPVPVEKHAPAGGGGARTNWWSAQFLACHVGPAMTREHYCDMVYGNASSSMARMHDWAVFLSSDYSAPLVTMPPDALESWSEHMPDTMVDLSV